MIKFIGGLVVGAGTHYAIANNYFSNNIGTGIAIGIVLTIVLIYLLDKADSHYRVWR